jgi:hypothetical protein
MSLTPSGEPPSDIGLKIGLYQSLVETGFPNPRQGRCEFRPISRCHWRSWRGHIHLRRHYPLTEWRSGHTSHRPAGSPGRVQRSRRVNAVSARGAYGTVCHSNHRRAALWTAKRPHRSCLRTCRRRNRWLMSPSDRINLGPVTSTWSTTSKSRR